MKSFPPKRYAYIQGNTLEYVLSGTGTPAIVLVNGAGGPLEGWYRVYSDLAAISTVFAYNRPGIDGSEHPSTPQTGAAIVFALRDLLAYADVPPPYVLVGHSLGGLYVNLYARTFPGEVAGVVMLEAAAPGDEVLQDQHQTRIQRVTNRLFSVFGAVFGKDDAQGEVNFVADTMAQIGSAGPFPDVPLTVVSGGKRPPALFMSAEAYRLRSENQRALVALSRYGEQVIAVKSGHFPQLAEPDVVIRAIREMVESGRGQL